jgi:hypothetical protein
VVHPFRTPATRPNNLPKSDGEQKKSYLVYAQVSEIGCLLVRRITAGVGLMLVMFMFLLVLEPLPVHAAPVLVQQNNAGCSACGLTLTVPFTPVTIGNIIVVGVVSGFTTLTSPFITDSLGSSFVQAATQIFGNLFVFIYYATLASSGADSVKATFTASGGVIQNVYIYEVSGVTATGLTTGISPQSFGTAISTPPTAFQTGAFLFGIAGTGLPSTVGAGAGFTASTANSGDGHSHAEFSIAGASSTTTFPQTATSDVSWIEVGIALVPAAPVVGGRVVSIDPLLVLMPWLILIPTLTAAVVGAFLLKRRMHHK